MTETLLYDIGVLIVTLTVFLHIGRALRQPNVLAYLLAGIFLGPTVLGLIENHTFIQTLSELGIAFLLFLVGLRIDINEFKGLGYTAMSVTFIQMAVTAIITFSITTVMGWELLQSLYIGVAVMFSSTVVVIKILDEKEELNKLYGRIDLGILLVQDIVVIFVLAAIASLGSSLRFGFVPTSMRILTTFTLGVVLVIGTLLASKYILTRAFRIFAESQEAFFVASLGWCMGLIMLAQQASLSIEIGAFLAGLSLAQLPYNQELKERVRPVTDVFVAIFFASLGLQINLFAHTGLIIPALTLSAAIMSIKFLVIFAALLWMRYPINTSFLSGLTLAQISEFSFILIALGQSLGHIGEATVALITLIGITSIGLSTYFIAYSNHIYDRLEKHIQPLEPEDLKEIADRRTGSQDHVVLVGCHVQGQKILQALDENEEDVLVIDKDPEIIRRLIDKGYNAVYGDIGDLKPRQDINIHQAKMVISTTPNIDDNKLLITKAKEHDVPIVTKAGTIDNALDLYDQGSDYVILPDMLAAKKSYEYIRTALERPEELDELTKTEWKRLEDEKVTEEDWFEVV